MPKAYTQTETKILDLAENRIREGGFNSFSFRDIADGVGVKSSSVHYHFPTKADLGRKVAERYTDRFLKGLGPAEDAPDDAEAVLAKVRDAFEAALLKDGNMCLCGVLAAEAGGLPEPVAIAAEQFFERTEAWLVEALGGTLWGAVQNKDVLQSVATRTLALLEGGMLMARVRNKPETFAKTVLFTSPLDSAA